MNDTLSQLGVVDTRAMWEKVLEIGSLGLVSLIGIIGNSLVLAAIGVSKDLRSSANGLVANLGIADLLVCCLVIPILMSARVYRAWLLGDFMCVLQGFINFVCVYASLFFLAAIAINRLVRTWSLKYYPVIFSKRNTGAIMALVWFMSVASASLPVFGWGRYAFDNVRDNCIFDRRAAPSYSIFLATVGILIPLITCALCYVLIMVRFIKNKSQLRIQGRSSQDTAGFMQEMRLSRNLFIVWLAFFLCWAPMISMLFLDPKGLAGRKVYVICVWFMLCNSCVNPIIYGLTNKRFRQGYRRALKCLRKSNVVSVTNPIRDSSPRTGLQLGVRGLAAKGSNQGTSNFSQGKLVPRR